MAAGLKKDVSIASPMTCTLVRQETARNDAGKRWVGGMGVHNGLAKLGEGGRFGFYFYLFFGKTVFRKSERHKNPTPPREPAPVK